MLYCNIIIIKNMLKIVNIFNQYVIKNMLKIVNIF